MLKIQDACKCSMLKKQSNYNQQLEKSISCNRDAFLSVKFVAY